MANYKPKTCAWCGTEFTPNSSRSKYCTTECRMEFMREYHRNYRRENKDHLNARRRENYDANKDDMRKRHREYYAKNAERIKKQVRERQIERGEEYLEYARKYQREWNAKNPERQHARYERWYAANRDRIKQSRAMLAQAKREGDATPELIEAKWAASDKTCILCGNPIDPTLPSRSRTGGTLVHLTPIRRGGRHDLDNIDFAHYGCNAQKRDKTLEEYRTWQANLQKAS